MPHRYVALLRAISNVSMQPFRKAMSELGFRDGESYGMSGNLLFNANRSQPSSLERRITARLGAPAFVRTRPQLARIVAGDPYRERPGASVLFLARPPTPARRKAFLAVDFAAPGPVLRGRTVFFVYPVTIRGKRTPLDLDRALGVAGTIRSSRVVRRLLERMA